MHRMNRVACQLRHCRLIPAVLILFSGSLLAEPGNWRTNRVLPLERVTVGPSDNYQAQVDASQQQLVFTRSQNLLSGIWLQQLETGSSRALLPADHDSKDPALSPDGKQLAMTLFRFDAPGDICIQSLQDGALNCLQQPGSREGSPFWINNRQLGYLQTHPLTRQTELKIHNLDSQQATPLLKGHISAPSASSDGQWLVYHRRDSAATTGLYLYHLEQQQEFGPLRFDLPGISSHARIDHSNTLYFSHYLNDTSADQLIDAEDHSVIFRLPLQHALDANRPLLPEQLTSLEHNCNFPALARDQLYITCAYEGSLDTYRLPLSGQVPRHWQTAEINQAIQQSSSYEQRLLLLNALRYRTEDNGITILERQLSNHLSLNEFTAARYYVGQLQQAYHQQPEQQAFFYNLELLLQVLSLHEQQPPGILTADFQQALQQARQQLRSEKGQASTALFSAWFAYLAGAEQQALAQLPSLQNTTHPLQAALLMDLSLQLHASQPGALQQLHLQASQSEALNAEGRLYHAFSWLKQLTLSTSAAEQVLQIQNALQNSHDPRVHRLYTNELLLMALAQATEAGEERQIYQQLSQGLKSEPNDLVWRRLAHIRAIQRMGLAEKYDFMELMSRHWLTATRLSEPGFAATAEQYGAINLARAYGSLQQQQNTAALNTFYTVSRQTADPEALYYLLQIGLQLDLSLTDRMQRLLDQLQAEGLLGSNRQYADALRLVLQSPQPDDQTLQQASQLLQNYQPPGINRGAADLLTGSILHRRLLLTVQGYRFDPSLFQRAHYHYMQGLDFAYNNPRTQAALLDNLGQLHFTARNYGLAAEFFAQRLQLPFVQPEDELWLRWRYARALFYSNRMAAAADQTELAWQQAQVLNSSLQTALLERSGFYALQADRYQQAADYYLRLLQGSELEPGNQARAQFSLAYAQFKLGQGSAARATFQQVLQQLPSLPVGKASDQQLLVFQPARLQLQIQGFMAQLTDEQSEQQYWLKQRIEQLQTMQSQDLRYGFDEQGRLSLLIQTRLQLAASQQQTGELSALHQTLELLLSDLQSWRELGASLASQPMLLGLYNYLYLAAEYPQQLNDSSQRLRPLFEAVQQELHIEPFTPAVNQAQQLKLQLLLAYYQFQKGQIQVTDLQQQVQKLQADTRWQQVKDERADWYQELEELAAGILSRSMDGMNGEKL